MCSFVKTKAHHYNIPAKSHFHKEFIVLFSISESMKSVGTSSDTLHMHSWRIQGPDGMLGPCVHIEGTLNIKPNMLVMQAGLPAGQNSPSFTACELVLVIWLIPFIKEVLFSVWFVGLGFFVRMPAGLQEIYQPDFHGARWTGLEWAIKETMNFFLMMTARPCLTSQWFIITTCSSQWLSSRVRVTQHALSGGWLDWKDGKMLSWTDMSSC